MRISGLASGMDTESMVKDLMNAHRIPLDKITQKKQYLEWQLDDYRAINRQLFDFSKNTFDTMILSNTFSAKTVNVSSPDDVAIRNMGSTSDFS
ncbi:MAG: flagellar cap protein FliD N-terminal domain-containing protein, partial [Sporosarcina sp.]